ncbi:MAG TPA: hypothetical protein VFH47_04750 [Candidatus Thermoplasmatota archaeon]|nr:hypothetical protein [Candidatus Thermoplasmatota archaeon]
MTGKDGGAAGGQPDLAAMAEEFAKQFQELGKQLKSGFEKVAEDAQYALDKEMGKLMAKHPELYAEIRKTMRQTQKTLEKAAEAFGLDKLGKP